MRPLQGFLRVVQSNLRNSPAWNNMQYANKGGFMQSPLRKLRKSHGMTLLHVATGVQVDRQLKSH
jgi:hypothetical protein